MSEAAHVEQRSAAEACPYCGGQIAASGNFCLDCARSMPTDVAMRCRLPAESERQVKITGKGLLPRWLSGKR